MIRNFWGPDCVWIEGWWSLLDVLLQLLWLLSSLSFREAILGCQSVFYRRIYINHRNLEKVQKQKWLLDVIPLLCLGDCFPTIINAPCSLMFISFDWNWLLFTFSVLLLWWIGLIITTELLLVWYQSMRGCTPRCLLLKQLFIRRIIL